MPGVAARDSAGQGDDDLRGIDQPGSRAHADRDTAAVVGVQSGAIFEGQEFAQAVVGVCKAPQAILGPAPMGARLLGSNERERDR